MLPCFPNYASPDQNNLVKSVIDTYENTAQCTCHINTHYGIVDGGRENFLYAASSKSAAKRSDARLAPTFIPTARAHTERGDCCPLDCQHRPNRPGAYKLSIAFAKAEPSSCALTALKLHLNYILSLPMQFNILL